MLFTYTPEALTENWLNPTIVHILRVGMQNILEGHELPAWPDMIPVARRNALRRRSGIRKRLANFWTQFIALDRATQISLLDELNIQTSLPNIFTNDQLCSKIESFPQNIRAVTIDLFRFLFEEQINAIFVGDKSLRDTHYSTIYNNIHARICPFCGLSLLRSPSAPKHALDHYMPISKYPFVGSDLRNLPPMCTECNTDYKRDTDVLQDDQGNKRHCVDPYGGPTFSISLTDSQPFAGRVINGIHLPRWEIKFIGEPQEQAENWDRIFKIRQRYENNILDVEFSSWLDHFVCWYIKGHHGASLGNDIAASIPEYIETVIQDGLNDRAFLKSQVFTLIQKECIHVERGEDMKGFLEILVMTLG